MFVDQVRIHAQAGDGGSGCCSFRREKFVPKGGPDGGDGGDGSDIILRANVHVDSLAPLYFEPLVRGKKGVNGMGAKKHGRSSPPVIVDVPIGTLVYRVDAPRVQDPLDDGVDEPEKKERLSTRGLTPIADLDAEGEEFVLCKGGEGGRGNVHFKSSRNRVPTQFTKGDPGEEGWFLLELRTIADAGLVGYPNAGKSTLIRTLSAAHPKVAPYPFTTLHPVVGVVELPEYRRLTVADIPGLIDGAHRNVGLGHEFLRHIVRCKVLAFVLDMAGSEGREPISDLEHLRRELDLYDPLLSRKPWFVVANKMDLPDADEKMRGFRERFPRLDVIPVSGQKREGIEALKEHLASCVLETQAMG